ASRPPVGRTRGGESHPRLVYLRISEAAEYLAGLRIHSGTGRMPGRSWHIDTQSIHIASSNRTTWTSC
ncbi:MAG: hypothetical protein ACQESR_27080, partial [Planctomycetota bacterium]